MTANIMTKSKIGKSNTSAMELFMAVDSPSDEKLNDFRKNSEWFAQNKDSLRKKYGESYVAIYENKICLTDKDPIKLLKQVKVKYGHDPSVVVSFIGSSQE